MTNAKDVPITDGDDNVLDGLTATLDPSSLAIDSQSSVESTMPQCAYRVHKLPIAVPDSLGLSVRARRLSERLAEPRLV